LAAEARVAAGSHCNWRHLSPDERVLRGKNEYAGRLAAEVRATSAEARVKSLEATASNQRAQLEQLRTSLKAARDEVKEKRRVTKGQLPYDVYLKASAACKEAGLRDIPGQFAKAITSTDECAKLHLQGSYAVSLSDGGYNLQVPPCRRRFDPRNKLKITTQCVASLAT